MKRPARILLNAATALSLLLSAATILSWVRSYRYVERYDLLRTDVSVWGSHSSIPGPGAIRIQHCEGQLGAVWGPFYPPRSRFRQRPLSFPESAPQRWAWHASATKDFAIGDADLRWQFAGFALHTSNHPNPNGIRIVLVPHWAVLVLAMALPAARARSAMCRRNKIQDGLCPHCGYDCRATPDRCPECGTTPAEGPRKLLPRI